MTPFNTLLGLPLDLLAQILGAAALLALLAVAVAVVRARRLARISLRNTVRQPLRTALILVGLMSATTFVATALIVDQTVVHAVETVAVYNLGRVDEEVDGPAATQANPLSLFPAGQGGALQDALARSPDVAGVAPTLEVDSTLVVDEASHQVRAEVSAYGFTSHGAGPLADLRSVADGASMPVERLAAGQVYLNRNAALFLHATTGDNVALYSVAWPAQRYEFSVAGIVTGGLLGAAPAVVVPVVTLQRITDAAGEVNRVYLANTGDGLSGVGYSDAVTAAALATLPPGFQVHKVKLNGVSFALQTQDTFTSILALFTLFALAINLLLVFLLFALLAAERRAELGASRAIGMRRSAVLRLLLFEGTLYGASAAIPGVAAGAGLALLLVVLVRPTLAQFGFPLDAQIDAPTLLVAFALGVLFTLLTSLFAAAVVSEMNVAAALRGLPEPPRANWTVLALLGAMLRPRRASSPANKDAWSVWGNLVAQLTLDGVLPLVAAALLLDSGITARDSLRLALGVATAALAVALLTRQLTLQMAAVVRAVKRRFRRHRIDDTSGGASLDQASNSASAAFVASVLVLYWLGPFDPAQVTHLDRYSGGIESFFVAGMLLVASATVAVAFNFGLLLGPLREVARHIGRLRHVTYLALVQPAAHRLRTGLGLAMLSLICFTMVVMACISASIAERYGDLQAQAGGYDIVGRSLFSPVGGIGALMQAVHDASPDVSASIAATSAAKPLPIGILQPGAPDAGWRLYPVAQIDGAFLQGVGLPLVARAGGYTSDAQVWQALREHPADVVVDVGALPASDAEALAASPAPAVEPADFVAPPIAAGLLGPSSLEAVLGEVETQNALAGMPKDDRTLLENPDEARPYTLALHGIVTGRRQIAPTPVWIADFRGGPPRKVTIIGVVDNAQGQRYGLLGSPATFAPLESGLPDFGADYYFFKLSKGADPHVVARAIGSALLDHGFETTVITDGLLAVNGPHVLAARVLVGLVALTLLVAVVAFMVTGLRSVIERRQQIGALRALGFHRRDVLLLFVVESLIVAALGVAIGLTLGLLLCQAAFAVGLFDRFQEGLALVIPWGELALICAAALGVSLIAALLPAAQASLVAPAEALRYE